MKQTDLASTNSSFEAISLLITDLLFGPPAQFLDAFITCDE